MARRDTLLLAAIAVCLAGQACSIPVPAQDAADPVPERFAGKLSPCPERAPGALCGSLAVFEDRMAMSGRLLQVAAVVLPARSTDPAPDAVTYLAGGPGAAASSAIGLFRDWNALRDRRDVLFLDARGTGRSHALHCDPYGSDVDLAVAALHPVEPLRRCLERLERIADPGWYTTPWAMDDLDEVRDWLGWERLDLIGTSGGTRAALVYLRRHPERVRTISLIGVAPPQARLVQNYARDPQRAFDLLVADCRDDPDCARAHPDLGGRFDALIRRLRRRPGRAEIRHPLTGAPVELQVTAELVGWTVRKMLYTAQSARRLPALLERAAQGNLAGIAAEGARRRFADARGGVSWGVYFSVLCNEDLAFVDPDEAARDNAGTFLGETMLREHRQICDFWPRGHLPDGYKEPVASDVPGLLFSGRLDPTTPPRLAADAAAHLPGARHLVVEYGHHGFGGLANGRCAWSLIGRLIETGRSEGIDASCLATMRPPAFSE